MQMYQSLKEAHSTSDFPELLQNTMFKVLIDKFRGVNSPWAQYTISSSLKDFKINKRIVMSEAPDLVKKEEEGPYEGSTLYDDEYQIQLETFGRTFTVGRHTIINDDLNGLQRQPARFGRASARTLAKSIVTRLEGHGLTYDGTALFVHGRNWANTALANTVAGIAAVSAAMTSIETATEPHTGEKMGLSAQFLLVPPELEDTALRIVKGTDILPVNTTGGTRATGKAQRLTPIVEPFLNSSTAWYVLSSPQDAPAIEVGFLNGKQTPDLLLKRADAVSTAGGDDPWGYEFDDIDYKVRHDWATAKGMHQGIYRGN